MKMQIKQSDMERFWGRVEIPKDRNWCWIWVGGESEDGYGAINVCGKTMHPSRFSYILHNGWEIPPSHVFVCHSCDVGKCVNPDHLWLGTQADNLRDMWKKGRGYSHGWFVTHCPSGHEYTEENTRIYRGRRHCRQCDRDRNKNNPERAAKSRERSRRNRRSMESSKRAGNVR